LLTTVLGPRVRLIDSAEETANAVHRELDAAGMLAPAGGPPSHQFVVSDDEPHFRRVGARFLGEKLQDVAVVPLG
jgi:glutamate racemase